MTARLPGWVERRHLYDDVEIHPVAWRRDLFGAPFFESCAPQEADRWALYLVAEEGDRVHLADYPSAQEAYVVAAFLSGAFFAGAAP